MLTFPLHFRDICVAGDPSASILEVLDPEQNGTFIDDFLDVPYDLSKVLFICTANDLSSLSAPLLDRMEIVRLEGYLTDEKWCAPSLLELLAIASDSLISHSEIARRFLIPKALKANGLTGKDDAKKLIIEDDVIENVIRDYSREVTFPLNLPLFQLGSSDVCSLARSPSAREEHREDLPQGCSQGSLGGPSIRHCQLGRLG